MTLSPEQITDLKRGLPVRVTADELDEELVLMRASSFEELTATLEDEKEQRAWAELARKAAASWARENAY